ncbi:hypothetical protein HDU92_008499 [Lobulomyces angularis]|nr:hypothetical protein HDU92_008499 [Lobulomyces angularis]
MGSNDDYNVIITAHGIIMIFLCAFVCLISFFRNLEREFVLYSVKSPSYLESKDRGDHSMMGSLFESMMLKTIRRGVLILPWQKIVSTYLYTLDSKRIKDKIEWVPKGSPKLSNGYIPFNEGVSINDRVYPMLYKQYASLIKKEGKGVRFYSTTKKSSLEKYSGLDRLEDVDLHITAYEKDGVSMMTIIKTIQSLKDHSFTFKPSRREFVPKPNGKMRPLGIPSPRDKIVQQVMVMILEALYEPIFTNNSHGFRTGRGTHTALKEINTWKSINWFIEGDIKSYFDTIDHHKLISLIEMRVKDQEFIDLIWKAIRAGYVEVKKSNKTDALVGTPQGSV